MKDKQLNFKQDLCIHINICQAQEAHQMKQVQTYLVTTAKSTLGSVGIPGRTFRHQDQISFSMFFYFVCLLAYLLVFKLQSVKRQITSLFCELKLDQRNFLVFSRKKKKKKVFLYPEIKHESFHASDCFQSLKQQDSFPQVEIQSNACASLYICRKELLVSQPKQVCKIGQHTKNYFPVLSGIEELVDYGSTEL